MNNTLIHSKKRGFAGDVSSDVGNAASLDPKVISTFYNPSKVKIF